MYVYLSNTWEVFQDFIVHKLSRYQQIKKSKVENFQISKVINQQVHDLLQALLAQPKKDTSHIFCTRCMYGKFMLWKMLCFTLQSMGSTNHKFPVHANMECSNKLFLTCLFPYLGPCGLKVSLPVGSVVKLVCPHCIHKSLRILPSLRGKQHHDCDVCVKNYRLQCNLR